MHETNINVFATCEIINADSLENMNTAINSYMAAFRQHFPKVTIPKQHILEHHCIPFIQHTHFGLGFLGEQGTENSHQAIKKLEKRACGITNDVEKLRFIMNTHLLHVSPVVNTNN